MFAPADAAPWYPDNVWGRSPDDAEPPLPACWLLPPLISCVEIPISGDGVDTGTGLEDSVDIPDWVGFPEAWVDPITGNDPGATDSETPGWVGEDETSPPDPGEEEWICALPGEMPPPDEDGSTEGIEIAPEPELPEEQTSWVDPIDEEYWLTGNDPGVTDSETPGWVGEDETSPPDPGEEEWICALPGEMPPPDEDGSTGAIEIAPEPELPEEQTSWVDLIFGEYRSFVEENPQWLEENGAFGLQSQVMTPSRYVPEIELGTPGAAEAFDRWYEQTYLMPAMDELPEESAQEEVKPFFLDKSPWLRWDALAGYADGDVLVDLLFTSFQPTTFLGLTSVLGSAPLLKSSSSDLLQSGRCELTDPEPGHPAPSPIAALLAEASLRVGAPVAPKGTSPVAARSAFESAVITAQEPLTLPQTSHSSPHSLGDALEAIADEPTSPPGDGDLVDAMAALTPLPAKEGMSVVDVELWLAPLAPNWPDLMIWKPA